MRFGSLKRCSSRKRSSYHITEFNHPNFSLKQDTKYQFLIFCLQYHDLKSLKGEQLWKYKFSVKEKYLGLLKFITYPHINFTTVACMVLWLWYISKCVSNGQTDEPTNKTKAICFVEGRCIIMLSKLMNTKPLIITAV